MVLGPSPDYKKVAPPKSYIDVNDFNSVEEVGLDFGSFCTVTVNTPSVDELPSGLLMLMLTVDELSLDDKCSMLVEPVSAPAR